MLKFIPFIFCALFHFFPPEVMALEKKEGNQGSLVKHQHFVESLSQELLLLKAQESYITNLLDEIKEGKNEGKNFITMLGQLGLFQVLKSLSQSENQDKILAIAGGGDIQMSLCLTKTYIQALNWVCSYLRSAPLGNEEELIHILSHLADDLGRSTEKSREDIYNFSSQYVLSKDDRFVFGLRSDGAGTLGWNGPLEEEDYHKIGKKFSEPLNELISLPREKLDISDVWEKFNPLYGDHPVISFFRNECLALLRLEKIMRAYLGASFQIYPTHQVKIGSLSYSIDQIHRYNVLNFEKFLNFVRHPPKKPKPILKRLLKSHENTLLFSQEKEKKLLHDIVHSFLSPFGYEVPQGSVKKKNQRKHASGRIRKRSRQNTRKPQSHGSSSRRKEETIVSFSDEIPQEFNKIDKEKERELEQLSEAYFGQIPNDSDLIPVQTSKSEAISSLGSSSSCLTQEETQEDDTEIFDFQQWYQEYVVPYQNPNHKSAETQETRDDEIPLPSLPLLLGRALKFYQTVFGQGYQELKIRDFNDFLRQVGGKKLRLTHFGYQPVKFEDHSVEIFYTVPNLSKSFKTVPFMVFKIHQPHPPRLPFPRRTLYCFLRKDLTKAGYHPQEK
jgi:hypothetical protein